LARREGDRAIVDVIDSGPGIAEENMPHLFEPLFTTKSCDRGTGLGLFISREIVERHGGDIGVRSAPGRGTIFTIRLPLAS